MRAALFNDPHSITVGERRDPVVAEATDAVVRVVLACVCGSDLWYYRGDSPFEPGPIGHEFIGVVEDVGADVHNVAKGDLVICPFAISDGTCPHCRHGLTTACAHGGFFPTIIAMTRHQDRHQLARAFGATDIVAMRGDEAIEKVKEMTAGVGVDAAPIAEAYAAMDERRAIKSLVRVGSV